MYEWLSILSFSADDEPLRINILCLIPRGVSCIHGILSKRPISRGRRSGFFLPVYSRQTIWILFAHFCGYACGTDSPRLGDFEDVLCWIKRWKIYSLSNRSTKQHVSERCCKRLLSRIVSCDRNCSRCGVQDASAICGSNCLRIPKESRNRYILFVNEPDQETYATPGEFRVIANISSRFNFERDPGNPAPPFPRSIGFTGDNILFVTFCRQNVA